MKQGTIKYTNLIKKARKHYFSSISFSVFLIVAVLFFITKNTNFNTSELAYIEHSSLGEGAGSVVPASCDSSNPTKNPYQGLDPNTGLMTDATPGSHFPGDCTVACPADSTHGTYDYYCNQSLAVDGVCISACSRNCGGGTILPYTKLCPPPSVCISFNGVCTPPATTAPPTPPALTTTRPPVVPTGRTGGCFVAGTTVLLGDGTLKNIEDVTGYDTLMTSAGPQRVMKRYHIPYKGLVYAFNGDGNYFVTPTHPFMTTEGWKSLDPEGTRRESPGIQVSKLIIGDTLILHDNQTKILAQFDSKEVSTMVYNFGVNGTHDFYADNYLVHNVDMSFILRPFVEKVFAVKAATP